MRSQNRLFLLNLAGYKFLSPAKNKKSPYFLSTWKHIFTLKKNKNLPPSNSFHQNPLNFALFFDLYTEEHPNCSK